MARFLATMAVQMQSVAIGWQIYSMTGSTLDLGLVGLAQFGPFIPLVLLAGQLADRNDRLLIINICYGVQLLSALCLLWFTLSGSQEVWLVFAILVVFGAVRAFLMPASQAVIINLVSPQHFGRAVALNSSVFQVAMIGGPALGGFIYLAGPSAVYMTVCCLLGLSSLLMLGIRSPYQKLATTPVNSSSILEGIRFIRSKPVVLCVISLDLFAVLFGGATALLPAYASDVLHLGPSSLGLLRTAPAVGAALTGMLLAIKPITSRVGLWMFGGVSLYGVATLVFGFSTSFLLSLVALAVMGAGDMVSVYIRHILVQIETPDAIRGRVSSVNSVFIGASNELGEFESGLTAAWLGLIPAVILGGCATLFITLLWMFIFPDLRTMSRFPEPSTSKPQTPLREPKKGGSLRLNRHYSRRRKL